jgi:rhamnosyltransferase
MNNKISALIVTYNFSDELDLLIDSIKDQVHSILIIDNFSNEYCRDHLHTISRSNSKITVDFQNRNKGVAEAYNIGLKKIFDTGYSYGLVLDQDSILDQNYIDTIMKYANLDESCIYCGNYKRSNTYLETYYDYFHKWRFERKSKFIDGKLEVSHAISSGTILTKKVFTELNGFINEMFIDYVDIEFCFRAKELGIPTYIIEDATFLHSLGYTTSKKFLWRRIPSSGYSDFRLFHICRNRVWCWKRFFYLHGFVMHDFRLLIGYIIRMVYVEKGKKKKLNAMLKGLLTGLKNRSPIYPQSDLRK